MMETNGKKQENRGTDNEEPIPAWEPEKGQDTAGRREELEKIDAEMPDEEMLYDLAELYKIFGDSTRIKILYALFEAELCVYDIAALLRMTQSAISHQLRILKQSKLVKFRRDGKTVYYSLADDHVCNIISQGIEHVEE